jgi:hypothetical protein
VCVSKEWLYDGGVCVLCCSEEAKKIYSPQERPPRDYNNQRRLIKSHKKGLEEKYIKLYYIPGEGEDYGTRWMDGPDRLCRFAWCVCV